MMKQEPVLMESFLRKGLGLFPSSRSPGQQQGQMNRGLSLQGSFRGFFLVRGLEWKDEGLS